MAIWTFFHAASFSSQLICLCASPFGLQAPWGKTQSPFCDHGPPHKARDTGRLLVSDSWRNQDVVCCLVLKIISSVGLYLRVRGCSRQSDNGLNIHTSVSSFLNTETCVPLRTVLQVLSKPEVLNETSFLSSGLAPRKRNICILFLPLPGWNLILVIGQWPFPQRLFAWL